MMQPVVLSGRTGETLASGILFGNTDLAALAGTIDPDTGEMQGRENIHVVTTGFQVKILDTLNQVVKELKYADFAIDLNAQPQRAEADKLPDFFSGYKTDQPAFSEDNRLLFVAGVKGHIAIVDTATLRIVDYIQVAGSTDNISSLAVCGDYLYVAEGGRYISSDPIGTVLYRGMAAQKLAGAVLVTDDLKRRLYSFELKYNHLYTYVGGHPINRGDPYGLEWNGNISPGSETQKPDCDVVGEPPINMNNNSCARKCCAKHDECYTKYKCNASSWFVTTAFPYVSCAKCNLEAVLCILSTAPTCNSGSCK